MWNQGLIDTTVIIDIDSQLLWAVVDKIVKVFIFCLHYQGKCVILWVDWRFGYEIIREYISD